MDMQVVLQVDIQVDIQVDMQVVQGIFSQLTRKADRVLKKASKNRTFLVRNRSLVLDPATDRQIGMPTQFYP
jgi:hypothetical protein